jgi:hypothetical protein
MNSYDKKTIKKIGKLYIEKILPLHFEEMRANKDLLDELRKKPKTATEVQLEYIHAKEMAIKKYLKEIK